jgi:hypothetical protein
LMLADDSVVLLCIGCDMIGFERDCARRSHVERRGAGRRRQRVRAT